MLCLRFRMDGGAFALAAGRISELVPWVELWPVKAAPDFIRGCFNYRGRMTPVVDMSLLLSGKPSARAFSSRVAVVQRPGGFIGMLLEGAVETIDINPAEFQDACVKNEKTPYLGKMALKDGELVQVVEPESLLTPELKKMLFPETAASDGGAVK